MSTTATAEADRQEVDPPIRVETVTWSQAGQLDWWVTNGMNGGVASVVQTAVEGGSELLIFVPRAAHRHDLSLSFVVRWTLSVQRRFRMEKSSTLSIGPQRWLRVQRCREHQRRRMAGSRSHSCWLNDRRMPISHAPVQRGSAGGQAKPPIVTCPNLLDSTSLRPALV